MKKFAPLLILLVLISTSCSNNNLEADAWGNFEATEVLVSSETSGRIIDFRVEEGSTLSEGDKIAQIDTTMLNLQLKELEASGNAVRTNIKTISSQNEILYQQIKNLDINLERVSKMLRDEAATQKQYDDLLGQKVVLEKQIEANNTRKASILSELSVLDSKKDQIFEKIARCIIYAPSKGTILQKYSEKGEITSPGRPMVKIADLSKMKLKVYISGAQLASVKIGDNCRVLIDKGEDDYYEFEGQVITIADKAEFTPKIIQTKDERVSMVYAVTILVENDGKIKSGMPGEAIFGTTEL